MSHDVSLFFFAPVCLGEVYAVACNPNEATMVATGGGDDKGFLWKIGQDNWSELQGTSANLCFLLVRSPLPSHAFYKLVCFP